MVALFDSASAIVTSEKHSSQAVSLRGALTMQETLSEKHLMLWNPVVGKLLDASSHDFLPVLPVPASACQQTPALTVESLLVGG